MLTTTNPPAVRTTLKTAFLPSLLAAAMTLSACSDNAPVADNEDANAAATEEREVAAEVDANDSVSTAESISAEDQLLTKLSDYRWVLATATDNNDQPITSLTPIKEQVTLLVNSQNNDILNYSVGCNTMLKGGGMKKLPTIVFLLLQYNYVILYPVLITVFFINA